MINTRFIIVVGGGREEVLERYLHSIALVMFTSLAA